MSYSSNIGSELSSEKFYGLKPKQSQEKAAEKQQVKQDPSTATGMQWAQTVAPQQAQAGTIGKQAPGKVAETKGKDFEIVNPSLDDVAVITTTVPMNEESVDAPSRNIMTRFLSKSVNMAALEESYKEYFKKSKSHNLLLERFMANVKFSTLKTLVSLMGVSAEEQTRMQSEVKEKALTEIDSKLKNEWAYTKAMLEITGG